MRKLLTSVNSGFDKNNVALTFASNGALESMIFGTESKLERLTGSLADTATQAQAFLEKRQKQLEAEKAAKKSATLNAIKAETELLSAKSAKIEAENKLRALGGEPSN